MSDETIVAIYDTPAHAQLAAGDLREAGVPDSAISIHAGTIDPDRAAPTAKTNEPAPREQGFWSSLFGGAPDHDTAVYERSVDDGSSVLIVKTPDQYVARVMEIVESHAPIDIDERALSYIASQTSGQVPVAAPAPLGTDHGWSADDVSASKRVVNRGGTRIRRFVVDR